MQSHYHRQDHLHPSQQHSSSGADIQSKLILSAWLWIQRKWYRDREGKWEIEGEKNAEDDIFFLRNDALSHEKKYRKTAQSKHIDETNEILLEFFSE